MRREEGGRGGWGPQGGHPLVDATDCCFGDVGAEWGSRGRERPEVAVGERGERREPASRGSAGTRVGDGQRGRWARAGSARVAGA